MEVHTIKYKKRKYDCPYVLSLVLGMKYSIPKLGTSVPDNIFNTKVKKGLKKDGCKTVKTKLDMGILKCDGYLELDHTPPTTITHVVAFLYNNKENSIDFFDSYNKKKIHILRVKNEKDLDELFHNYFEDEFTVRNCFIIDYM